MKISHPDSVLKGELSIAGSKSESNRALMIQAYMGQKCDLTNLSDSNDTRLLSKLLDEIESSAENLIHTVDCADAGTVCRFLLTFLAQKKGKWLLTGTERLNQRPIAPLVESLRQLGADLSYVQKEKELPIIIKGVKLKPCDVEIDASQSSQFVSSLLLLLPMLQLPIQLKLVGKPSSLPYIDMTIAMMNHFGAKVSRVDNVINVLPSEYVPKRFVVSPDWSSASYWLEAVALGKECNLVLKNFTDISMQGDSAVVGMFRHLGVSCSFSEEGLVIKKVGDVADNLNFDFLNCPDLFPSVVTTCAALNKKAVLSGVRNLQYKESDRVGAMVEELSKMGAEFTACPDCIILEKGIDAQKSPIFSSHNDHRIAMALSMLALKCPSVEIIGTDAVKKSYLNFWSDMYLLGFELEA